MDAESPRPSDAARTRPAPQGASRRRRVAIVAGVFGVLVLALVLRFTNLGAWSYWSDEAFTVSDANGWRLGLEGNLPAHQLSIGLFGLWFDAAERFGFPLTEGTVRAMAAVFGVLGIAAILFLGARFVGSTGAWFAGLLLTLSPFHLYWSQNARAYALELALAVPAGLGIGFGLLGFRAREAAFGALCLVGAAFAHPTALTLAPGLAAAFLLFGGAESTRRLPAKARMLAALVASLAIGAALVPLRRSLSVHFAVKGGGSPALFASTCVYYFRPTLLAAAAILALRGVLRRDRRSMVLTLLGFGSLASGFVASLLVRTNAQYVFVALPFLALLVGREIADLGRASLPAVERLGAAALAAALVLDFAGGAFLYHTAERGHRAPWREACQVVFEACQPGEAVVSTQATVVECYLNPRNPTPRDPEASLYINRFEANQFEIATRCSPRAWFLVLDVDLDEWPAVEREVFRRFLWNECRPVADWTLQFAGKNQTLRLWRFDALR